MKSLTWKTHFEWSVFLGDDYFVMNYSYRMSKSIIFWKFYFSGESHVDEIIGAC